MELKKVGSWLVFFLVFWCFSGNAVDDKEVIKGVINVFGLISTSEKPDEILVEVLGNNCRVELIHLKRIYKNLGFGAPEAISTTTEKRVHDQESAREDIQKALDSLNPLITRSLYKCFRKNYIVSSISGKDVGLVGLFPEHGGSLLRISNPTDSSRRQLAEAPSNPLAPPPADTTGDHPKGSHRTIIIVVAVTAVGTFVLATIVFLFARKAFSGGSGFCHKNDTTSNNAVNDSSPNTSPYKKSNGKEKMSNQLNFDNFTRQTGVASLSGGSAIASSSAVNTNPGRHGAPSPLMHPPGWANSSPSPASLSPASHMGGPPRPPPPMPPPAPPKKAAPQPPGPPPPPGPRAPPPPKNGSVPPRPPSGSVKAASKSDDDAQAKLKPFFWDKVMANPDHSMVWDQFKSGSFQFNEEMIESLFGYVPGGNQKGKKKESSSQDLPPVPQLIQLIDQKKAQNLSILLRALNVTTEEIRDALLEGHELPSELLETLLKMAPTTEEELKLRLFDGDISQLGTAERFLKGMVDIPFAFKRMEALLFMVTLEEDAVTVKENLTILEAASKEVRSSRLFLKLLEAVLKTGNRMNTGTYRGGAQAFKLDTLLKLADVKGTDGKTTLLHFVVQEIIRSEGVRAARGTGRSKSTSLNSFQSTDLSEDIPTPSNTEDHYRSLGLEVVSGLGDELQNVRKAAGLDYDSITGTIVKLGNAFLKTKNFLNREMDGTAEEGGFHKALRSFIKQAEDEITELQEEEKRIMKIVKNAADYFHGNSGKEEGLRLFVIVRDFVIMLEKVCREVKAKPTWPSKSQKTKPPSRQSSSETPRTPSTPDFCQLLFPAIAERRQDHSSSDDEFDSV